jgi:hypothetical protein
VEGIIIVECGAEFWPGLAFPVARLSAAQMIWQANPQTGQCMHPAFTQPLQRQLVWNQRAICQQSVNCFKLKD